MKIKHEFYDLGTSNIIIRFSKDIDLDINRKIKSISKEIYKYKPEGFLESYYSYGDIVVSFNNKKTSNKKICKQLKKIIKNTNDDNFIVPRTIKIPVIYDGVDLDYALEYTGLSKEEFINIHTMNEYPVYMIGFLPGFCYLGGLDKIIHMPRLETPRQNVLAGSVGIANNQTGIYPLDSPGGWRIIGHTDYSLFDINKSRKININPGDNIKFYEVKK